MKDPIDLWDFSCFFWGKSIWSQIWVWFSLLLGIVSIFWAGLCYNWNRLSGHWLTCHLCGCPNVIHISDPSGELPILILCFFNESQDLFRGHIMSYCTTFSSPSMFFFGSHPNTCPYYPYKSIFLLEMEVSWNRATPLIHPFFGIFHSKPSSILGCHLWKPTGESLPCPGDTSVQLWIHH